MRIGSIIYSRIVWGNFNVKIYKKRFIERKKVKYVICNKCGKSINLKKYEDFLDIVKTWGYNSNFDNETHEIDICQDCYELYVCELKIKPKKIKKRRFFCL